MIQEVKDACKNYWRETSIGIKVEDTLDLAALLWLAKVWTDLGLAVEGVPEAASSVPLEDVAELTYYNSFAIILIWIFFLYYIWTRAVNPAIGYLVDTVFDSRGDEE